MTDEFYLPHAEFRALLEKLSGAYEVFVPVKKGRQRFYKRLQDVSPEAIVVGEVRPFEPLKAFFTRARETVALDFKSDVPHAGDRPFAVVGVKACDLKGFKVQDFVFGNHGQPDPFYVKNRASHLIISSDCTCAIETCYCLALGVRPHPRTDFDINLSPLEGGFAVEIGSEKGRAVVQANAGLFRKATGAELQARDAQRDAVVKEVEENIRKNNVPSEDRLKGVVEKGYNAPVWEEEAKTCVECGACTIICPTCHCFLLYDQKNDEHMARLRVWDSCMLKDYARVAGGGNPRKRLWMRLRNRFEKKFDFFPKAAGVNACTGCGRCISACPAKIDIRRVLKRLVEYAGA